MVGEGPMGETNHLDVNLGLYGSDQFSCLGFLSTLQEWNGKTLMGKQGYFYVACMNINSNVKEKKI